MTDSHHSGHYPLVSTVLLTHLGKHGDKRVQADEGTQKRGGEVARSAHAKRAGALTFDEVYQTHFDFVWRCARRLGVAHEDLDDVAQDVFVIAHRKLDDFRGDAKVETWLFRSPGAASKITFAVASESPPNRSSSTACRRATTT